MNILLITADQWRGQYLSGLGHPIVKTPNLDMLAQNGVLFRQHFVQATPCSPSRTSLHTGMYMFNHRCVGNGTPLASRFTNWALEARAAGYDPSLFGYTDTPVDPTGLNPNDPRLTHYSEPLRGIGDYTPIKSDVSTDWVAYLIQKGYPIPEKWRDLYNERVPGTTWHEGGEVSLPLAIKAEDHETCYMVDQCMNWIDTQRGPWISHLSLLRPHPPFVSPEPYNLMYAPENFPEPNRFATLEQQAEQHPFLAYMLDNTRYKCSKNTKKLQEAHANYCGLMTEVDDNLGRMFSQLKQSGHWDSTLIIFTSDHGEQMGDHWLFSKLGFYDESYHVPLIIFDPRSESDPSRGKQLDMFTENIDIMPTMLDWLGAEIPSQCDGYSLCPVLRTGNAPEGWRREVHWEYDFRDLEHQLPESSLEISSHQCGLSVVRNREYKYVHFSALPPLLFDLKNDPQELINRANDPAYQAIMLEFSNKLLSWRMNHTDRGLTETLLTEAGPIFRSSPVPAIPIS